MNIGIDIEEVKRFAKYVKDKDYLERIFAKEEISYSILRKNAVQHLAARFAAKEAVWKALSTKNKKLIITDISIQNTKNGKPQVYIKNKQYKKIEVSLSHTKKYVAAVAIAF
ncbi:MAG: holo-ACP synthase [Endomicrobium sp.]|jgi:holo-[acyl-carrier protein] synthase|nr:holo-ACP synthase [Endomicrobium sp.]